MQTRSLSLVECAAAAMLILAASMVGYCRYGGYLHRDDDLSCTATVRHVSLSWCIYVDDYDSHTQPATSDWPRLLDPYLRIGNWATGPLVCNAARPRARQPLAGYAYNGALVYDGKPDAPASFADIPTTAVTFWCCGDGRAVGRCPAAGDSPPACEASWRPRHRGRWLVARANCSVVALTSEELDPRRHPDLWPLPVRDAGGRQMAQPTTTEEPRLVRSAGSVAGRAR